MQNNEKRILLFDLDMLSLPAALLPLAPPLCLTHRSVGLQANLKPMIPPLASTVGDADGPSIYLSVVNLNKAYRT